MPVVVGKKHNYARMDLDCSTHREVIVSMDRYVTEAIDEFPEEMMQKIKTPAGNHLFKVDDEFTKIFERNNIMFQIMVLKLLFLSKLARTYIQPKIAFPTTRVRNPDEDDWKKIRRVLSYLDATINSIKLHLNANDMNVVH